MSAQLPSLQLEQELWQAGYAAVAGCDEVGRGAWAGPVSVGVVVAPLSGSVAGIEQVRDSKMLTEATREQMFDAVADWCQAWEVGHATSEECDQLGLSQAQRLAAWRALENLGATPDYLLVDGRWDFIQADVAQLSYADSEVAAPHAVETKTVIKGDRISVSIAAASVLAKVTRDRWMRDVASEYPEFGFDSNKGYPSPKHKTALKSHGVTPIHRQSWAFMENLGLR